MEQRPIREAFKKRYYLDGEIVPISFGTATIGLVSEHLDEGYCSIFIFLTTDVIGK